ncbi:MAG: hypothetical protein A2Y14_05375 [Verrucomicrobia bacterium GWF2_51_19]|nr:MAG: hypothetical protein A2Y14_05375 [Verrucomicrobia bacterium GWF2_51_19]HCJ12440.1 hypothetical protein [Opitutae bacterium]
MSKTINYILFFCAFSVFADSPLDIDKASFFILEDKPKELSQTDFKEVPDKDNPQLSEITPVSRIEDAKPELLLDVKPTPETPAAVVEKPEPVTQQQTAAVVEKPELAKEATPVADKTAASPNKPAEPAPVKQIEPAMSVKPEVEEKVTNISVAVPPKTDDTSLLLKPEMLQEKKEGFSKKVSTETTEIEHGAKDVISVDFPEEQVRLIVRSVAELYDLNVVIPNDLRGTASIRLRNVTWQEIFKAVLEPLGFTYAVDGNIIKIRNAAEPTKEPLETVFINLTHSTAKDVVKNVQALVDSASGGKIGFDERTNILILTERKGRIEELRKLVTKMDAPEPQVMIETKFIDVNDSDIRDLGLDWSVFSSAGYNVAMSKEIATTGASGPINRAFSRIKGVTEGEQTYTQTRTDTAVLSADQFKVTLKALNVLSKSKITSTPTVVTMNNTPARIAIATSYPIPEYTYNETQGNFAISGFKYTDFGTVLKVTPKAQNRFISLHVEPEVSTYDEAKYVLVNATKIPIIDSKKADTLVTMRSGYTLAIGGLMKDTKSKSINRVPLLGYIPIIGSLLFSSKKDTIRTENTIVFVTATQLGYDGTKELYDTEKPVAQNLDSKKMFELGITDHDMPNYQTDIERARYEEIQKLKARVESKEKEKQLAARIEQAQELEDRYK